MDKTELRKKDFVTSIVLIGFGIWMILYTVIEIPMKDSWGGVMNVWFVSPGLFPLSIGMFIIILGVVLLCRSVKDGGVSRFVEDFSSRKRGFSEKGLRFMGILVVIFAYVYLNIPRIDYFLSTLVCLVVFISFFYFDSTELLKRLFTFYFLGSLFFFGLFVLGIDKRLNSSFEYFMDILVFLFLLSYVFYSGFLIRGDKGLKRKFRITLIMSVVPSLVLIPSFKYFLLVPLPVEGAFIELMNIVRYSLR